MGLSDGKTLAAGAYGHDGNKGKGTVRIYRYNKASRIWDKLGQDLNGEGEISSPGSVALSDNGNTLAVEAYRHYGGKGTVRIYRYNDASSN